MTSNYRVKRGETYWSLSDWGEIFAAVEEESFSDWSRYMSGRYFKTEEEAKWWRECLKKSGYEFLVDREDRE